MKERIREITDRNAGRSMQQVIKELRQYLLGWKAYFGFSEVRTVFRELDGWIRRRLRVLQLKQWRRGTTVFKRLRKNGTASAVAKKIAMLGRRYAYVSKLPAIFIALPDQLFDRQGLPRLAR
jgi:hypothetical protein